MWSVAAVGAGGLVLSALRRRPEDLLLVGSAVMTAAVPLAFFGDSRFKVPVIPLLVVAAAVAVQWMWDQRRSITRQRLAHPVLSLSRKILILSYRST